jgi:hypothetical protein
MVSAAMVSDLVTGAGSGATDGPSYTVEDDDALVCDTCGEQFIGERAAALLLSRRALAPDVEMTATVRRRTEVV